MKNIYHEVNTKFTNLLEVKNKCQGQKKLLFY